MSQTTSISSVSPNDNRLTRLYRSLPVIVITCILILVGLELGLRLLHISYPDFGTPDQDLGWALRPGAEGIVHAENPAGVFVRINSDGMRDAEHALAKPPHTLRIAVLGNSYTEAFPVPQDQAYWSVMGRALEQCGLNGIQRVEVLNFGVGGYGTAQDLVVLRKKVWKYQPDIVLLAFLSNNDVWYNVRALNQQPSPYFVYKGDTLELDNSFQAVLPRGRLKKIQIAVQDRSRTLQLVAETRRWFRQWVFTMMQKLQMAGKAQGSASSDIEEVRPVHTVYAPPRDAVWQDAWHVTEGIIALMHREVDEHKAQFWIATLTAGIQVHPDPQVRRNFAAKLGVDDLYYPDNRIRALAERDHIPVVTLSIPMAEYAGQHHVFLHGFPGNMGQGHWNELGNRVAAELIAREICARLRNQDSGTR